MNAQDRYEPPTQHSALCRPMSGEALEEDLARTLCSHRRLRSTAASSRPLEGGIGPGGPAGGLFDVVLSRIEAERARPAEVPPPAIPRNRR